jgi:SAM-dependent methyltransferase
MLDDLVREYEAFYRDDPERWTADDSALCWRVSFYQPTPARVLDVGCGNGHTLAAMQAIYPSAQMYGIDLSRTALHLAAGRVPGGMFDQSFVEGYHPDVRFDVITVVGVAEHFIDPAIGLTCIARLLAEGGICYIEVPHNLAYSPGTHSYRRLGSGSGQMEWHLERAEWERLIGNAGFTVLEALKGDSVVNEFVWVLRA